ncbi:DUF6794 domain-containing protein [Brevifollis gellanilyticus]|uniref:DUF6794 domain-containing protein n=1 Tax=Brevifollis gellanilyticus TaxID=748831 RepID=A0A512MCL4_9BACT|nr:DUF6794 domain-containing protein [Brevifollis gellanilyticus]GEP44483.1 hypothetical protein BGE01nite_37740 [Brevifollis gellanilyticus]
MKIIITLTLLLASSALLRAEDKKAISAQEPAKEKTPSPKTLEEAHLQLEKLLAKDVLAKIDAMKSEKEMIEFHLGLGMGMRNGWGLWGGGPLAQHMRKLGFHHPDDMSCVILETFWCRRHGKDFRLKERADDYAAYWKAVADPPESAKDPKDGSEVVWKMSFGADSDDRKTVRQIHVGKSKKTGRWLAYEHDKGVYEPHPQLLKQITEHYKPDPRDPFTSDDAKPDAK